MNISRRKFFGTAGLGFVGLRYCTADEVKGRVIEPFGPLVADPGKIIDLPEGFEYRVISEQGKLMVDGFAVPGMPDGMACFEGESGNLVLVRNHELGREMVSRGPFEKAGKSVDDVDAEFFFDKGSDGGNAFLGGTTNLVFDPLEGETVTEFLSLVGTDRNCAGGPMPWGSWITCEEPAELTGGDNQNHGWCFEVKAVEGGGLQKPVALKSLGRCRHEAVALDPRTGILYLTEDRDTGLLYRFIPEKKGDLSKGALQALVVVDEPSKDLRNYYKNRSQVRERVPMKVTWMDLEGIDSPDDDLRFRGFKAGAAKFARGEGIHFTADGIFICCTDGGPGNRGQIFRLEPALSDDEEDVLELFLQPMKSDLLTNGDNLCPAPWGGIVVCEDLINSGIAPSVCVRCVTLKGEVFTIARNSRDRSEFAGCCFSPDGKWLFVNMQAHGLTLAITGPWEKAVG